MTDEQKCWNLLTEALKALQEAKPAEHSETSRYHAITITELEKVIAFYAIFVLQSLYLKEIATP